MTHYSTRSTESRNAASTCNTPQCIESPNTANTHGGICTFFITERLHVTPRYWDIWETLQALILTPVDTLTAGATTALVYYGGTWYDLLIDSRQGRRLNVRAQQYSQYRGRLLLKIREQEIEGRNDGPGRLPFQYRKSHIMKRLGQAMANTGMI